MIEEIVSPHAVLPASVAEGGGLGYWLIECDPERSGEWASLPVALKSACHPPVVLRGRLTPEARSLAGLRRGAGEVLLLSGPAPEDEDWLLAVRTCGKGLVVPADPSWDPVRVLDLPVVFVPPNPTAEVLVLALFSADAAARREGRLREEGSQLQQRLQDRIVLERAKDVLERRLKVSEEEAYLRLRGAARRQRRALRDVARAILDTETLLDPPNPGASGPEDANR